MRQMTIDAGTISGELDAPDFMLPHDFEFEHEPGFFGAADKEAWADVVESFGEAHEETAHTHHGHGHDHEAGCDHTHAVQTKLVAWTEKATAHISNRAARKVVEYALRGTLLAWMLSPIGCPGDELWPMALHEAKILFDIGDASGDTHRTEPEAILPNRTMRLVTRFSSSQAQDTEPAAVPPPQPDTESSLWQRFKERVNQQKTAFANTVNVWKTKPSTTTEHAQQIPKRTRTAGIIGALACVGIVGGMVNASAPHEPYSSSTVSTQHQLPYTHSKDKPAERVHPSLYTTERIVAGDTQWDLSERQVRCAGLDTPNDRLIQTITGINAAVNRLTNPNEDVIYPGQQLRMIGTTALRTIEKAVDNPAQVDSAIHAYLRTLQQRPISRAGGIALRHIERYVRTAS